MRYISGKNRAFIILSVALFIILLLSSLAYAESAYIGDSKDTDQSPILSRNGETQVLIKPKAGIGINSLKLLHKRIGAKPLSKLSELGVLRVNVKGDVQEALAQYMESGLVEFAEPNYLRKAAAAVPDDPYYVDQWGLGKIEAESAWDELGSNTQTINVAILDTGIDLTHEDLQGVIATDPTQSNSVLGKHFFTDKTGKQASDNDITDSVGHGTHIAGIIGAVANNGKGIAGISSAARIMPVKVLDGIGYGNDADIAQGLVWATDNKARIINLSLSGSVKTKTLGNAVKYAVDRGVIVIAATGNEGNSGPNYPAAYDGVIGVGATDDEDMWMHESNYGSYVDLVAPGVSILSTYPASKSYDGTEYEVNTGTSMAASFVSGLASLILTKNPNLTGEQVKGIMMVSATDLGQTGWDRFYGYGRIDANRALGFSDDTKEPTVAITSPASGTVVSASSMNMTATASDIDSDIAFVEFLVNGTRAVSTSTFPYQVSIKTKDFDGLNKIQAVVYDKNGNSASSEITCYKQSFTDVGIDHWAFLDIEALEKNKVLTGYPDGSFMPGNFVGRAEFVKMLIEGLGLSKKTYYSGYFKDVPKTGWAWPYVEAAYDMGLVNGYTESEFAPDKKIKRVEVATILIKTGVFTPDYSGSIFNDVASDYWGFIYVMSAKNAGIVSGYPGNSFRPENVMSRAEAARVINKSFNE